MSMNSAGARDWRRITAEAAGVAGNENDNKSVAIVLEGVVYSAPCVSSEIGGGVSQISGSFIVVETEGLANDRKRGVSGKSVSVRVDHGGRLNIKKKNYNK